MPRFRHTVEQIIAKLREAEVAPSKWTAGWDQRQSHAGQRGWGLDGLSEPPYQSTRGTHWGKRGSIRLFPSG
jgi:hypothetical protein